MGRDRKLSDRHERLGRRIFTQVAVLRVRNRADDLIGARGILRLRTHTHLDPERRGRADIFPEEGLVDDQDQWVVIGVALREVTSRKQRNSQLEKKLGET